MSESRFHKPLESPRLYDAVQRMVGFGDRVLEGVYERGFGASTGIVLDLGCGPTHETPLPTGTIIGLDVNPRYVRCYAETPGSETCEVRGVVGSAARLPFATEGLDECRSVAVLHHLPDALVVAAVREMYRVLRPGGRIAIFDMVLPARVSDGPVASLLCALDRGRHVRTADALGKLMRTAHDGGWLEERVRYAWPRLHGVLFTLDKS